MFAIDAAFGQDARVVTFKHAIRWLSESDFPNYFLNEEIRNSINEYIKADLKYQFNFKDKGERHESMAMCSLRIYLR